MLPLDPVHAILPEELDPAALWRESLEVVAAARLEGRSGGELAALLASTMDRLVRYFYHKAELDYSRRYTAPRQPFAICAAGGYGRSELLPYSDVDLLVLYSWKADAWLESVTETILYGLWDLGLTVGHAVRTPADCVRLGREDLTIRTNLIDLRFVAGDLDFFGQASEEIRRRLIHDRIRAFARGKLDELRERRERYGDTHYLLEPDVKEGSGGLRDVQTIHWIARAAFRIERLADLYRLGLAEKREIDLLERHYQRLLTVRTDLHLITDRAHDRLTFDVQEAVARRWGFSDRREELASERFMRTYYGWTRDARRTVDRLLDWFGERLGLEFKARLRRKIPLGNGFHRYGDRLYGTPSRLEKDPANLVRAFRLTQRYDLRLSPELQREIESRAHLLATAEGETRARAGELLTEILLAPYRLRGTLEALNESGVLRMLLPPFEHLYARVQHDTYHIYTADEHLFVCADAFRALRTGELVVREPELSRIAQGLRDPAAAAWAVLLHDIGKGYGTDHSRKGAELVEEIGRHLDWRADRTRKVAHLVRHHLAMSHTAQRQDITDPHVIHRFAQTVGDTELLEMLFVLTYCDQIGVGPGVWTDWKRDLLHRLYEDARRVLEREDIQGVYRHRIRARKRRLAARLAGEVDAELLQRFLDQMPSRFFLRHEVEDARLVLETMAAGAEQPVALRTKPVGSGTYLVVLSAPDRPGLFALQAQLFTESKLNILAAEGYALADRGQVLNLFHLQPLDPLFFEQPDRVERFERRARHLLLEGEPRPPEALPPSQHPLSRRRSRVRIDTTGSRHYTIVEVQGWDRLGLLQALAYVFYAHGLDIALARIDTEGRRVSDVFYVQRADGGKPTDPDAIAALERDLLALVKEH